MRLAWATTSRKINEEETIENPSADDIRAFMGKLDDDIRTNFVLHAPPEKILSIINASKDRVVVRLRGRVPEPSIVDVREILSDPAYADSDEEIDVIGDPDSGPYFLERTVPKEMAIEVLTYFAQHELLPAGYMWFPHESRLDKFMG